MFYPTQPIRYSLTFPARREAIRRALGAAAVIFSLTAGTLATALVAALTLVKPLMEVSQWLCP